MVHATPPNPRADAGRALALDDATIATVTGLLAATIAALRQGPGTDVPSMQDHGAPGGAAEDPPGQAR